LETLIQVPAFGSVGRLGELGFSKISNILAALGLELKLQAASTRRPTLEELLNEKSDVEGLDRRR
jgi:hypothetical protein